MRYTKATGGARPAEVTGCDRERAVKAYVEVLEEEGLWVDPGFKWDPTCPSISIIARHIATAREEGRQEEERRQPESYDTLRPADGGAAPTEKSYSRAIAGARDLADPLP